MKRRELDGRTHKQHRLVLQRRHDDFMRRADAVNVCWTVGDREIARVHHPEVDMKCLPELPGAPCSSLSALLSTLVSPTLFDSFATLGVFASVFVKPADVRLKPRVEDRRAHGLQKLAHTIPPAELFLGGARGDKI